MRKRFLNKKGITIAETVVAMTVITIVTVSAISVILSSTKSTGKAAYIAEAQDFSLNALECFRSAEDAASFEKAIDFIGGFTEKTPDDTNPDAQNNYIYTFKLENSGYTASVTVNYGITADEQDSFSVTVKNGDEPVTDTIEFTKN